jgi:hypothetical protein
MHAPASSFQYALDELDVLPASSPTENACQLDVAGIARRLRRQRSTDR